MNWRLLATDSESLNKLITPPTYPSQYHKPIIPCSSFKYYKATNQSRNDENSSERKCRGCDYKDSIATRRASRNRRHICSTSTSVFICFGGVQMSSLSSRIVGHRLHHCLERNQRYFGQYFMVLWWTQKTTGKVAGQTSSVMSLKANRRVAACLSDLGLWCSCSYTTSNMRRVWSEDFVCSQWTRGNER